MESDYLPHFFREWNTFDRYSSLFSRRRNRSWFYYRVEKNWVRDDFTFDLGKGSTSGATRDFHRCQCYAEQVSRADTHCERKTSGAVGVSVFCGMGEVGKTRVKNWARGGEGDCSRRASSLWFMKRKQHGVKRVLLIDVGTREKVGLNRSFSSSSLYLLSRHEYEYSILIFFFSTRPGW